MNEHETVFYCQLFFRGLTNVVIPSLRTILKLIKIDCIFDTRRGDI